MTKYVLNSGNVRGNAEKAKKYIAEVVKGLGDQPKILLCLFANAREIWEQKYENYQKDILKFAPEGIEPVFEMATPEAFREQVKKNDVVYIHGGDDHLLQYWLRQMDLPEIWKGKTIATSSASSDAVVQSFWTGDWRECMEGLGFLPIKFIAHYKSPYGEDDPRGLIDWEKAHKELAEYGDKSLPIYALKEGDFVVFEVK